MTRIWEIKVTEETSGQYVMVPVEVWEQARELLREVTEWHSDPKSTSYNDCDEDPCMWCDNAEALLAAAPHTDAIAYADAKVKEAVEREREAWILELRGLGFIDMPKRIAKLLRARGET